MSETGHSKNIISLDKVIGVCESWGSTYNPSKASIKLAKLKTQHTDVDADNTLYATKARTNGDDKNLRKTEFAPVKKLGTKVVNALKATDASDATIADAEGFLRKLRGERAGDPPKKTATEGATGEDDNSHSVSQQSFTNIVEHLKGLNLVASTETSYNPNETELKTANVTALIVRLTLLNKNESTSFIAMENARISRDNQLYADKTGVLDTVEDIKEYAKSVFGANSPQLKQLTAIKFSRKR